MKKMGGMAILLVMVVAGCYSTPAQEAKLTSRFWRPKETEIKEAEAVAKQFCWNHMSNQGAAMHDAEMQDDFTIKGIPFLRYRRKHYGFFRDGSPVLHIEYFDPQMFPDW